VGSKHIDLVYKDHQTTAKWVHLSNTHREGGYHIHIHNRVVENAVFDAKMAESCNNPGQKHQISNLQPK